MNDSLRIPPPFIEPETLKQLSEEQQLELIESIRTRRMLAVTQYLMIQEDKKKAKGTYFEAKFDKMATKVARHITKIDQELEKIEAEFTKLRILRLEAFDIL